RTTRIDDLPIERVFGDVLDAASVRSAMKGCEGVIHLASLSSWTAIHSPKMSEVVLGGTKHVLDAARTHGNLRTVFVSSSTAINGSHEPVVHDENSKLELPLAEFRYAAAKEEAERRCRTAAAAGLPVMIVNPGEVYGPDDVDKITAGNLLDFAQSSPVLVCDGGTSVVHVEDVADGIIAALDRGRPGERYILGGENLTIRQLAELTNELLGRRVRVVQMPNWLVLAVAKAGGAVGAPLPFDPNVIPYAVRYWFMDNAKARRELGVTFRSARETLAPTIEWLERTFLTKSDRYLHPRSEDELVALVKRARSEGRQVRVRGSAHSVAGAIYSDGGYDVMLDRYRAIHVDEANMRVTVQAGCNLGDDPRDPTGTATWESSLLAELARRGWALPDLGGVSHQTISGFLMTGSCGGTARHAIDDAVVAVRLVDGTGKIHELVRGRDERFFAVPSSMGLLGIVSTVTLQCIPHYDIVGDERITPENDAWFAPGPNGLEAYLRSTEYARILWWPQEGVKRFATWQARRMSDADYTAETGPRNAFQPKPYSVFGDAIRVPALARAAATASQHVGGAFYDLLAQAGALKPLLERRVLPAVLRQFVELDGGTPQQFWDTWSHGLPMDNQMSESALPTTFTEIFVPLSEAAAVITRLREHFTGGIAATGTFAFEIYAARASDVWMHPSYGHDTLRIDVFWFARDPRDPSDFYEQFWRLLAPFGYRLHWAKHLPRDPALGATYLQHQFPRWNEFLALRAELDPDGVFLNRHWAHALGVSMPRTDTLPHRLQQFYEALSVDREAALDRLGDVFTDDIHFRDPFRDTNGMPAFRRLFERALAQYPGWSFTEFRIVGDAEQFTLTYNMRMRMAIGPEFVTPMASVCVVRDGKVSDLTDYYDFTEGLLSPVRLAGKAYRAFINRMFL
ncbi:MAG TPA: FAD-binding protein, partial [Kofleriaceae bacterium]